MEKELRPAVFRKHSRALILTIPAAYVREMGLVPGDTALLKREPDGLRLRIIRHSTLVELANAQESTGQGCPVEQEAVVEGA
jgi:phage gp45-like